MSEVASFILSDGKKIRKPFPLWWIIPLVLIVISVILYSFVPVKWNTINLSALGEVIRQLFTPRNTPVVQRTWKQYFDYLFGPVIWQSVEQTFRITVGGTAIGTVLAFPVAVLVSSNVVKTKWIYVPLRLFLSVFRTIPAMILAVVATIFVGLNELAGIVAISLFTFGIITKMFYESVETVDMAPFEALESSGAGKIAAFRYGVLPQITPMFLSYTIYMFEMNFRASAILGFVGAGGIGVVIDANKAENWDRVGAAIIVIFIVCLAMQLLSNALRNRIMAGRTVYIPLSERYKEAEARIKKAFRRNKEK